MTTKIFINISLITLFVFSSCNKPLNNAELTNEIDSLSYCLGLSMANWVKDIEQDEKINKQLLFKAIKQTLNEEDVLFDKYGYDTVIMKYVRKQRTIMLETNLQEGRAFLEKNKKQKGVTVLPSGLQYKVIKEGNGPVPKDNDYVKVFYTGYNIDGEEFVTSNPQEEPFMVAHGIPGWTEALKLMKAGSKWKLFIPTELAYGDVGAGDAVEPNCAVIFDFELLAIAKKNK